MKRFTPTPDVQSSFFNAELRFAKAKDHAILFTCLPTEDHLKLMAADEVYWRKFVSSYPVENEMRDLILLIVETSLEDVMEYVAAATDLSGPLLRLEKETTKEQPLH